MPAGNITAVQIRYADNGRC